MCMIRIKTQKVLDNWGIFRQVVVLYSNDYTGICLGGSALVFLDEWSSCRGGSLNRFDVSLFPSN